MLDKNGSGESKINDKAALIAVEEALNTRIRITAGIYPKTTPRGESRLAHGSRYFTDFLLPHGPCYLSDSLGKLKPTYRGEPVTSSWAAHRLVPLLAYRP